MQKLGFFSSEAHRCCLDISSPAFEEVQKLSVSLGQLKVAWIQTGIQTQNGTPILPILDNWGLPGYKQEFRLKTVHQFYPSWTTEGCLDTNRTSDSKLEHQFYPSWTTEGCLDTNRTSDSKRYIYFTHHGHVGVAWIQAGHLTQKGTPILPILDKWGLPGYKQDI